jgi:phosphatidylserine decarboxylase
VTADDGVELMTDVYHPIGIERGPVIVERSGYGRQLMASLAEAFAERGYHYVLQTVRGIDGSGGEHDVFAEPADGRVTIVRLADGRENPESLVSIFLSPLDVHINRSPIGGEIRDITYKTGKFVMATRADARLLNEQNTLTIQGDGLTVRCTQIAGILARRIVCWKQKGDRVKCGERFGMIKFGSRTDLLLPPIVDVVVHEGMKVQGGVTIIGRIRG